jgi:hypothetical protein
MTDKISNNFYILDKLLPDLPERCLIVLVGSPRFKIPTKRLNVVIISPKKPTLFIPSHTAANLDLITPIAKLKNCNPPKIVIFFLIFYLF